jgi:tRNA uridine 5-carbamoylmethylation protein Kti12
MECKLNISNKEIFVILLCGIPGVGKTYFTQILKNKFENEEVLKNKDNFFTENHNEKVYNFLHILNFDKILLEKFNQDNISQNCKNQNEYSYEEDCERKKILLEQKFDLGFILNNFKNCRKELFERFKNKIDEVINRRSSVSNKDFILGQSERYFIILDDNFYFKSMRKPFFKYCKEIYRKYSKIYNLNEINNKTIYSPSFDIQISYLEIHFRSKIDYALKLNSNRSGVDKIPDEVILRMSENFQWESFNKHLFYTLNIDSLNSLHEINFTEIISKLEENKNILQEIVKISLLESQFKSLSLLNKKENKAKFLDWLEINLRRKIGELIKSFNSNNSHNVIKNSSVSSSLFSKALSEKKKEFLQLIKNLIYKSQENTSINLNMPLNSPFSKINFFNLNFCLENLKENNYLLEQKINCTYLEKIIKEFENFAI